MTPKMSGEDFYFLQKLKKYGRILIWNEEKVYPAARFSDRVYFGTGPAMIRGNAGDWSAYPVYSSGFFDEIGETYRLFDAFYTRTQPSRVTEFLSNLLKEDDPFKSLRENTRDPKRFIRACHEKFDGLRILQYLRMRQTRQPEKDEDSLRNFLIKHYSPDLEQFKNDLDHLDFKDGAVEELEKIRSFLVKKEEEYQLTARLL
jgi:hypothetical protein